MNKRFATMIIALAVAVTGITVPADKAKAQTVPPPATEAPAPPGWTKAPATPGLTPTAIPYKRPKPLMEQIDKGSYSSARVIDGKLYIGDEFYRQKFRMEDHVNNSQGVDEGKTSKITKGFDTRITIDNAYGHNLKKWTTSDSSVVSIKSTDAYHEFCHIVTVHGKKYGKATLTAEFELYEGITYKASITLKVVKNEYKDLNKRALEQKTREQIRTGEQLKGYKSYVCCKEKDGPVTIVYDKKGNLRIKYTIKHFDWTKYGKKRKKIYVLYRSIFVRIEKDDKYVIKKEIKLKNCWSSFSYKKPTGVITITVPKKYLKEKKVDFMRCNIDINLYR